MLTPEKHRTVASVPGSERMRLPLANSSRRALSDTTPIGRPRALNRSRILRKSSPDCRCVGLSNKTGLFGFTSAAGEACAAIRKKGPVRGSGYAWVLVATKCVPKGKTISDQEIGEFIAAADFRA